MNMRILVVQKRSCNTFCISIPIFDFLTILFDLWGKLYNLTFEWIIKWDLWVEVELSNQFLKKIKLMNEVCKRRKETNIKYLSN